MVLNQNLLKENIISLLGIQSLSDEEKQAMIDKVSLVVEKRVMLRVMELLSEEDSQEMIKLEGQPAEEILLFISQKVPNLHDIMKEEVIKVKQELLNLNS